MHPLILYHSETTGSYVETAQRKAVRLEPKKVERVELSSGKFDLNCSVTSQNT